MSIKSTSVITRYRAIERITTINALISEKKYRNLADASFEPDTDVEEFINRFKPLNLANIEEWTDEMLSNQMNAPFFRYSMFDNYV